MGRYGVIDFDEEEINAAGHWYGGQGSMLYAILSTGALSRGTIRPKHRDGTPMTDDEWMIDLAERLESEADAAIRDAKKQAKKAKGEGKKELLADIEGLHGISLKAADYIHQATKKVPTSAHARKKTRSELQRDIDETLAKDYRVLVRVEGASKPVHVSSWMTRTQAEHEAKNHKAMIRDRGWTHVVEIEDKHGKVTRSR
jgi:hypothetical protein